MKYAVPNPRNSYCELSGDRSTLQPFGISENIVYTAGEKSIYAGFEFKDSKDFSIPYTEIEWANFGIGMKLSTFNETERRNRKFEYSINEDNGK